MNLRPAFSIALLFSLAAISPARARIVVDDSAPETGPQPPGIAVPDPTDGNGSGAAKTGSAPVLDSLMFLNKDQLHGKLVGIGKDGIRWQSPEAAAAIVFKKANVAEIRMGGKAGSDTHAAAQLVGLTNKDQLPGNVVSLDDKNLTLDTWYAGKLTIPRAMLARIAPLGAASTALYEGPTGMEGWVVGNMGGRRSWSFKSGALLGTNYGSIGRDVKLPDMSSIQFDAVLRGNGQLSISIYSDHSDNFGNCYMLQLNANFAELQRYSRNGGSNDLGSVQFQNAMRRDKMHVELRTNKEKKSIWLFVDGKMVKEWSDPAEFNGRGGCILFACQPGSFVKITNIKITSWNGKFEDAGNSPEKSSDDTVKLANQDQVTGRLEGIKDGKVKFASSYAELDIPLDRIQEIDLASSKATKADSNPGDVRATFPSGGAITMELVNWDSKSCAGSSKNFGQASFSPEAFTRIQFNLGTQTQVENSDEDFSSDAGSTDAQDQ